MTNICPLSGKPITDPIVVTFYNNTQKTYEAGPLLEKMASAKTRMPEGFESNIHAVTIQDQKHAPAIAEFMKLNYASVRWESAVLHSASPKTSPKTSGEGLSLQNGDTASRSSSPMSQGFL